MDDESANCQELPEILTSLIPQLRASAQELFKGRGCSDEEVMLPGTAMSAKDLVSKTILILLTDGLWKSVSRPEELLPFALRIMKHDFLDLVKSPRYKLTAHDPQDIYNIPSPNDDFEAAEAASLLAWLVNILRPDEKIKTYLEVLLMRGVIDRADIAHEMGISAQEVTNIRERVRPKVKIIRDAFTNGAGKNRKKG